MKDRPIEKLYSNQDSLTYPSMPQYYIEGYQSGCYYEIYVNGILRFSHFRNVGLANHAVPINDLILKSGVQRATIKLYPLGKIGENDYPTIENDASFELTIYKRDKQTPWEGNDYTVVKEYFAPTTTGKEGGPFKHAGVPIYEETFIFDARVPYTLTGWSESQVLEGKRGIEKEVLAFYKKYADVIQKQNEEKWAEMVINRERDYFRSVVYNDKSTESIKRRINEFTNTMDNEEIKIRPMDKYKLVFGAEGRVVTLRSIDRRGKSPFSYTVYRDRNGKRAQAILSEQLTLHKPKGSDELEIIR